MTQELTIIRPDDWHLHLRDGAMLSVAANATAKHFSRAIVMPNLTPPVTRVEDARAYLQRIKQVLPQESSFEPLMTLYLTDATSPQLIEEAAASGIIKACKLYPANATTNSAHGVTDVDALRPVFETMAKHNILLLVHGEVTHADIDIFDREAVFIDSYMRNLVKSLPELKIVFEHITTAEAAEFVLSAPDHVGATITPQHLMYNRNHLLAGGLRPHNYCLPVLKRQSHQQALQQAVASGTPKIFLGTDSAPHLQGAKESACGCAGCYSAPAAIELYAEIFEQLGILDKLEAFASFNGPDFYGLPRNKETITLSRQAWQVPSQVMVEEQALVPFYAGETLQWQVR